MAFAPVENPKIAVAVLAEHMGHGGSAAAPLAKESSKRISKLTSAKSSIRGFRSTPARQPARQETP